MGYEERRAVLKNVRFSFMNVLTPKTPQNGTGAPKYSATVLLPKSDKAGYAALKNAINKAIEYGKEKTWHGQVPAKPPVPIHDGDGVRPATGEEFGAECKGHWVFTASCSAERKPSVVGTGNVEIIDPSEVYSGMYGHISLQAFPYNYNGRKGIGFGLEAIKKTKDGEPLGGYRKPDPNELFDDDDALDISDLL